MPPIPVRLDKQIRTLFQILKADARQKPQTRINGGRIAPAGNSVS